MTYKMNKSQFENVISLSAQDRYTHFITKVADWQQLWTLKSNKGFVMFSDDSGQQCIPIWPHPDYAGALASGQWSDSTPDMLELDVFLDRWIPGMIEDDRQAAVFPIPNGKGIVVAPGRLKEDILNELEQYE